MNMETYQQSVELFIHSFQAQPLFAGSMLIYTKSPSKRLTTIKGNKAKVGVLLRWFVLELVAFSMLVRIPFVLTNAKNAQLNSLETINIYLTIFTFLCLFTTAERYRNLGCSPEKISSFVNSLFLMKEKYFQDAKIKSPLDIKAAIHSSRLICLIVTGPIQVMVVLTCVFDPTLAINVFWFLPVKTDPMLKFIQTFVTAILNLIVWQVAGISGYGLLAEVLMGMIPMLLSQKVITRRLEKVIDGKHTLNQVRNEIIAYRAFTLVVELFNECASSVIVMFWVTVGAVQIIPAALLIQQTKSDLHVPLPLNVFLFGMVVEAIFIILCVFSFPGEFSQNSKTYLDFLQRKVLNQFTTRRGKRHAISIIRSCSVLKIRLGSSNSIEKTTPPLYQLFCTERIIDILLTQISSN